MGRMCDLFPHPCWHSSAISCCSNFVLWFVWNFPVSSCSRKLDEQGCWLLRLPWLLEGLKHSGTRKRSLLTPVVTLCALAVLAEASASLLPLIARDDQRTAPALYWPYFSCHASVFGLPGNPLFISLRSLSGQPVLVGRRQLIVWLAPKRAKVGIYYKAVLLADAKQLHSMFYSS